MIADGEQIRRVIHNIISNAIKYMDKPKGIIQIRSFHCKKDPGGSWRKGLGNQQAWNRHNHVFCT